MLSRLANHQRAIAPRMVTCRLSTSSTTASSCNLMSAVERKQLMQRASELEAEAAAAHLAAQHLNKQGRYEEAKAKYAEMRSLDAAALSITRQLGCQQCLPTEAAEADGAAAAAAWDQDASAQAVFSQLHTPQAWPEAAGGQETMSAAAQASIVACLLCDAAATGVQWIYDLDVLTQLRQHRQTRAAAGGANGAADHEGTGLEFYDPVQSPFLTQYSSGRNSPYGEQTLLLLQSLAEQRGLHCGRYAQLYYDVYSTDFDGYMNASTVSFLRTYGRGLRPPATGADDAQADCVARLAPLVALFAGDSRLMQLTAAVTRVTQDTAAAVAWACAGAAVLERLLLGQGAAAAVQATAQELEQHQQGTGRMPVDQQLAQEVAARLRQTLDLQQTPHAEAVEALGRNCHLPNSCQTPLHAVLHQEFLWQQQQQQHKGAEASLATLAQQPASSKQQIMVAGIRDALAAGGCCASRASFAGACIGALLGPDALPASWLDQYYMATSVEDWAHQVLSKEWRNIRSFNLGIRSGTGVIDDILYGQLYQLAQRVNMLACDPEATKMLVQMARKLDKEQFEHVQVLLDVLGLEELSDYLRLMCCRLGSSRSSSAAAKSAATTAATAAVSASSKPQSGILRTPGPQGDADADADAASGGLTSRQRRQRAAAGVFELTTMDGFGGGEFFGQRSSSGAGGASSSTHLEQPLAGLKFARLLPAGHILVKTAEDLKSQYEFQAALAAAAAAAAARAAAEQSIQQPVGSILALPEQQIISHDDMMDRMLAAAFQDYVPTTTAAGSLQVLHQGSSCNSSSGSGSSTSRSGGCGRTSTRRSQLLAGQQQQKSASGGLQQWHFFRAPNTSLAKLWKAGREATTAAVLQAANLQVRELPADASSLLLTPGIMLQPHIQQHNQLLTAPSAAGASTAGGPRSRLGSRRGSVATSRPNSPRNQQHSTAGLNALPPLQLSKVDSKLMSGGTARYSSRPGSAVATSRFAPSEAATSQPGAAYNISSSGRHHEGIM